MVVLVVLAHDHGQQAGAAFELHGTLLRLEASPPALGKGWGGCAFL
ncbi:hypothetical protein [Nonomuraea maheshkhaliensis]